MSTFSNLNDNAADLNYCRFGVEALLKLLQTIEAQIGGVEKSEDI
jgi:hypothetical protein